MNEILKELKIINDERQAKQLKKQKKKELQQAINNLIYSREPYSIKLFTNNEKLSSYCTQNGEFAELATSCSHFGELLVNFPSRQLKVRPPVRSRGVMLRLRHSARITCALRTSLRPKRLSIIFTRLQLCHTPINIKFVFY